MADTMTRERIMEIAKTKGEFTVHRYLYRAASLRKACFKMVTAGLLTKGRSQGEFFVFHAPKQETTSVQAPNL